MKNIEDVIKNFCKRTPTANIAWVGIVAKFLKMYPNISREDFELCMLRQGKKAAMAMKDLCVKHDYDHMHKVYGITEGFFDACLAIDASYHVAKGILKKVEEEKDEPFKPRRAYHRNPTTNIYMTIFRVPADEYPKEAVDFLRRFIDSLDRPLQIIECTNPCMIEVRELRLKGKI